jgi:hypothetical protein
LTPDTEYPDEKPKKRGECTFPRPCPFISCKWNAIWGKSIAFSKGRIPTDDEEIVDMIYNARASCVLDICDKGGATLEEVGSIMNLTRERVRQIEGSGRAGNYKGLRALQQPRGGERIEAIKQLKVFTNEGDL